MELPNTIEGMVALSQMDDDYYEFDEKKMLVFGKRTKKSYRLGDKVVVSVAKVDRMMGTIDFAFAEETDDFQELTKKSVGKNVFSGIKKKGRSD